MRQWLVYWSLLCLPVEGLFNKKAGVPLFDKAASVVTEFKEGEPEFLKNTSSEVRIVNFYTGLCQTSQDLSEPYIELSKTLQDYEIASYAVNCGKHKKLCAAHNITNYPTIMLYVQDMDGRIIALDKLHPYKVLEASRRSSPVVKVNDGYYSHEQDAEFLEELEQVYALKRQFLETDVFLALFNMMDVEVYQIKDRKTEDGGIIEETASAIKNFLILLRQTYPNYDTLSQYSDPARPIANLTSSLLDDFIYIKKDVNYLAKILQNQPLDIPDWSRDCRVISDGGSSYMCAMWKLIFRLSYGIEKYNAFAVHDKLKISYSDVVRIIQDIESHVGMGCIDDDCSALFHEVKPEEITSLDQFRLWLTELRGEVQELMFQRSKAFLKSPLREDDQSSVTFPRKHRCPRCSESKSVLFNFLALEYGTASVWEELLPMYDIVFPEEDDDDVLDDVNLEDYEYAPVEDGELNGTSHDEL